jgi:hypothetical protein
MLVSTAAIILYDPADNEPPVSDKKKASYSFASTMGSYGGGIYGGVGGGGRRDGQAKFSSIQNPAL